MNVNFKLETSDFCYAYSQYKIINFNNKEYILPEKNSTKKKILIL